MRVPRHATSVLVGAFVFAITNGCGGSNSPTSPGPPAVKFGETTVVAVVNPPVNDANQTAVPAPGADREGVRVSVPQVPTVSSDATGSAVLSPLDPGNSMLSLEAGTDSGQVSVTLGEGDLHEVAIALDSGGAQMMAEVIYRFGGRVVEITPSMPIAAVNDTLAESNLIVFFHSGTYTGDLDIAGSAVTLFGEGPLGGAVTLNGNVTVSGSSNRIRGANILGSLTVPASDFGLSYSHVEGATDISGSSPVLLLNDFCGVMNLSGSSSTALGNRGLAPLAAPSSCP